MAMVDSPSEITSRPAGFSQLADALEASGWPAAPEYDLVVAPTPEEHEIPDGGPYCPTCRGARFLRLDRPPTHPEFGKVRRCPDCEDLSRAVRLGKAARVAGLDEEQRSKTFATFRPVQSAHAAVKAAASFANDPDGWLVIYGLPGSGKTHLGLAIANALVSRERAVTWCYVPRLVHDLREQVANKAPDTILPALCEAPVLILDDLGAARWTDYVGETMELLFDDRYHRRKPTVITLIGDMERMKAPDYDVAEDVKKALSFSIGRRMQDPSVCKIVRNGAPQFGRGAGAPHGGLK